MRLLLCKTEPLSVPCSWPVSTCFGLLVWGVSVAVLQPGWSAGLFLLAPLVLVRLALELIESRLTVASAPWRAAHCVMPWAALSLVAAYAFPPGWQAAALAVPWFATTVLLSLSGAAYVFRRPRDAWAKLPYVAALGLVIVGGAFAVISRAGLRPMDFSAEIIQLTAVHFHYAALILPVIAGLLAEALPGRVTRLSVLSIVAGIPLLAIGMTWWPPLEIFAAVLLFVATCAVGVNQLRMAARASTPNLLMLWSLSGVSLLAAMVLALVYATGQFLGMNWLTIPIMLPTHGVLNAIGFSLCGLLAWRTHLPSKV